MLQVSSIHYGLPIPFANSLKLLQVLGFLSCAMPGQIGNAFWQMNVKTKVFKWHI